MERVEMGLRRRAPRRVVATVAALAGLWQWGPLTASAMPPEPDPVPVAVAVEQEAGGPADPSSEPILPPDPHEDGEQPVDVPGRTENGAGLAPTVTLPPLVIGTRTGAASAAMASGGRPAQRLKQVGSIPFPLDARPKCEVLDSFGDSRSGGRAHEGIDILATLGQAVYAVADGTLVKQYVDGVDSSLSGNGWKLRTSDRSFYFYAHLSRFAEGLVEGSTVRRGDVIGYVGDTGNPGPGNHHLHFEYHPQGGAAVDALALIDIPSVCKVY